MADDARAEADKAGSDISKKVCFVVMPFGTKPRGPDQRPHDFDKIYRVVIRRAVERAGMICIRADETKGSRMIHTDMFRDLRDQPLVIADLSLHNPNVFYELGVRHTMSSTGTVLICEKSSFPLPFDIGLSRVVSYEYDGVSLDWEEAERLVEQLHVALLESGPSAPDSPVHALLERVLSKDPDHETQGRNSDIGRSADLAHLQKYIDLIVQKWRDDGTALPKLFAAYRGELVGCSALGELILGEDKLPAKWAPQIAKQLSDLANFVLAVRVYQRMHEEGIAGYRDLIRYGSAHSECHPDLAGAKRALQIMGEAVDKHTATFAKTPDSPDAVGGLAYCLQKQAGLRQWKWELSKDPTDLQDAIAAHSGVIDMLTEARKQMGGVVQPGLLAQSHLKRMLLLRIQANTGVLDDLQGDIKGILDIRELATDDEVSLSYLRWYRTVALADSGASDRTRQSALEAFSKDADLMSRRGDEFTEIGQRQYSQLRRLLDSYASWFRNPELIGVIGQTLQARRKG